MQSLCEVCRWKQSARKVAFSMEFVPKGEPEGCEWRGWERKSAPSKDGGGGMQLAPERQSFRSWLDDLAVGQFVGVS
jgi:hypothetical protein